jgi:endonuclease YncB( thermonuclease family)
MMYPSIHHAARRILLWIPLFVAFLLCLAAGAAFAAAIGDQVELNATHQAGVPLHQEPRGTNDFQRIPDGTRAQVIDVAKGGQWLKLSLSDGRTGWVTSRYVRGSGAGSPSTGTSPAAPRPQRIEEGMVERVADGDTLTVITANQTKLRIRMFGIDAPETPKGHKFPGQPYGTEAEAYLQRLIEGKRVTVEIYGVDRYKWLLSTIFIDGKDINLAMIEVGLAEVYRGPESGNPYKQQYQTAEDTARSAKKGMWVLGDTYESPRAYRKRVGIS